MYQYERGVKKKNVGYARIEARNGQCKITLHLQLLGQSDSIFPTYLIHRDKKGMDLLYLGDSALKGQVMESKLYADENNIMDSGVGLANIGGILIFLNDDIFFASEWDDKPIDHTQVMAALKPKEEKQLITEETIEEENIQETAVQESAVQETAVQENAVQESAVQEIAVQENAVQENAVQEKAVQENAVQEETLIAMKEMINLQTESSPEVDIENKIETVTLEKLDPLESVEGNNLKIVIEKMIEQGRRIKKAKQEEEARAQEKSKMGNEVKEEQSKLIEEVKEEQKKQIEEVKEEQKKQIEEVKEEQNKPIEEVKEEQPIEEVKVEKSKIVEEIIVENIKPAEELLAKKDTSVEGFVQEDMPPSKTYGFIPRYVMPTYRKEGKAKQTIQSIELDAGIDLDKIEEAMERQQNKIDEAYQNDREVKKESCEDGNRESEHPLANRIFDNYPRIYPFEDNEIILCVKIEPKDIGFLPMDAWVLSNNSFLLHGYYCYHHLIFAKIKDRLGSRYILGVPGIFHNKEKFMAKMFGFDDFKSVRKRELKQGDFGYWYLTVKL